MQPIRLTLAAVLVLAPLAHAQLHPLPGMPMVPPPVPHPALGAQPLFGNDAPKARAGGGGGAAAPAPQPGKAPAPPPPPRETNGKQVEGKDLKQAVAKVKSLKWIESLAEAKAQSAATGKPIFWLQALGDIDGFA